MENFNINEFLADLKQLCAIDSGRGNGEGARAMADFFEERYRALN